MQVKSAPHMHVPVRIRRNVQQFSQVAFSEIKLNGLCIALMAPLAIVFVWLCSVR